MIDNFEYLYEITGDGVIHQKIINRLIVYDYDYVHERYDKFVHNEEMAYLRLGFLLGSIKENINKILDVGYGNGAFLNVSKNFIKECYGYDISNYPLSDDIIKIDNIYNDFYDVICFF